MDYYEKLSRDIEAGKITPDESTMTRDPQAGERLLLEAAGAETWEQLAQDAENGVMTPDPNREALHGEAAAEAGRAIFREVFGTDDLDAISDEDLRRGGPAPGDG